jgi:outer membrane murein-binding lipoprotein Lpp
MRDTSEHQIIQGNFAPARSSRILRITARVFSLMFGLFVVGALVIYGVNVHYEDSINQVARDTRDLNEQNKELQVKLNHIRSFKNVEAAATKVPHLHMAETIIDVPASPKVQLPSRPKDKQEFPRVYGY